MLQKIITKIISILEKIQDKEYLCGTQVHIRAGSISYWKNFQSNIRLKTGDRIQLFFKDKHVNFIPFVKVISVFDDVQASNADDFKNMRKSVKIIHMEIPAEIVEANHKGFWIKVDTELMGIGWQKKVETATNN